MDNRPLVTVGIVSFNSSSFIIETLESIKKQTYSNIELIISDDASSDNTVLLCREWINNNHEYFKNIELITVETNTGTSGNCQRVLNVAHGEWIKFLAADDLLIEDAIEKYVNFISHNTSVKVLCAESTHFYNKFDESNLLYDYLPLENICFSERVTAKEQYTILQKIFIGSGPTSFFNTSVLFEIGGFDMRFPLLEDHPLFLRLTQKGYKISLLKDYTVHKRIHKGSVINERYDNSIYSNQIKRCIEDYKLLYKSEHQGFIWNELTKFSIYLHTKVLERGNTRESFKCRFYHRIQQTIDPFILYNLLLIFRNKLQVIIK